MHFAQSCGVASEAWSYPYHFDLEFYPASNVSFSLYFSFVQLPVLQRSFVFIEGIHFWSAILHYEFAGLITRTF